MSYIYEHTKKLVFFIENIIGDIEIYFKKFDNKFL